MDEGKTHYTFTSNFVSKNIFYDNVFIVYLWKEVHLIAEVVVMQGAFYMQIGV